MAEALQAMLQTVTQNLPSFIATPGRLILGEDCYTSLIYNVAPTTFCLRLAVSKGLGIGIIVFGSILKLPQIITIVQHSSAWGISLSMYSLEVVAYDISLAYAFRKRLPFSTYGENASLTVQNMVITLLIIWYGTEEKGQRRKGGLLISSSVRRSAQRDSSSDESEPMVMRRVILAALLMLVSSIFLFLLCPPNLLSVLQAFSIPISLLSKFPQIGELYRNKKCGHLSSIVVFAQLAGTLARVFTTITETGDWLLGIGFGLASILNTVIAIQYVYYWRLEGNKTTSLLGPRKQNATIWNASSAKDAKKEDDVHELSTDSTNTGNMPSSTFSIFVNDNQVSIDSDTTSSSRKMQEKGRRLD
ncbi:mannose-P-dolichol utilization defect 1 protein [Meira miltonrushii]|uniref:Mannose-P-dolichol utilization defect 1 protein n=1 Tax=Meira miltonrushii TaxID=1280837 RepID=A0A316V4Y6_9BASI|nr:mannose-P-dolichol utilization defect 1 protein [Meira miltonrushii]PWN31293.1 mannose-P-dolichol utilization defect 1 protein [Meira miltonrushii]